MNKKLLALYGLKFNPFSSRVPESALWVPAPIETFCWRIEQQIGEGGFALVLGDPGSGKSAALRILEARLGQINDLCLGVLSRPQAQVADFYRELGDLFGVPLSPHNRWNSSKMLREKWLTHIENSLYRPVLLVDEAQEMKSPVLNELRLLSSAKLDSRSILTIILSGDNRLIHRLDSPDLLPVASRVRCRLRLDALSPKELSECFLTLCTGAGNPSLMTTALVRMLCEHAGGNLRLLMNMGNELLLAACRQEREKIDEKLYFETFDSPGKNKAR